MKATEYAIGRQMVENCHCPFCGGVLKLHEIMAGNEANILYGTVTCKCFTFPIVEGILCLLPPHDARQKMALELLQKNLFTKALYILLRIDETSELCSITMFRMLSKLARKMSLSFIEITSQKIIEAIIPRILKDNNLFDLLDRSMAGSSTTRDYMRYRFSTPSLLSCFIILAGTYERNVKRIIDVGSGFGHNLFFINMLYPQSELFAVDGDFWNLYLSKRFFYQGPHICCDLNFPSCFPSHFFDMIFTSDCLHYISCKKIFIHEIERVLDKRGYFISSHMHNAEGNNATPGIPLNVQGWISLFKDMNIVMVSESKLLEDYFSRDELDLSKMDDSNDWSSMAIIGGNSKENFKLYENVSRRLKNLPPFGTLIFNPIFDVKQVNSLIKLHLQWPSDVYRAEFGEIERYFQKYTSIALDLNKKEIMDDLVKNFIVIKVPDGLVSADSHLRVDVAQG